MGMESTNIENDPGEARLGSSASGALSGGPMAARAAAQEKGPLSQYGSGGAGDLPDLLQKQIRGLDETRQQKKAVIDEAIKNLSTREPEKGPSAEELFRLMGKFATPTKTGNFFESLGGVGETAADILKQRRESKSGLQDLMTKYKLQGLDVDAEHLKEVVDATKTLQAANSPVSVYGKTAQDEGLKPGTPAFAARVQELAAADLANKTAKAQGPQAGAFDTKSGNFVAPNGTVIKAGEIKEDRGNRDAIVKLQDQIKLLDPKTIKQADSLFDYTGAGHFGELAKTLGSKFDPKTAQAQSKITAAALNDRLKNLPPGPASDKDISQAKSTFPGFANAQNLQDWVDRTNLAIDNYMKRQDDKYGGAQWYGAGTTPGVPGGGVADKPAGPGAGGNASGNAQPQPDDKGRFIAKPGRPGSAAVPVAPSSQPANPTPKVGSVYKGYRYLGGDPSKKESYEKV
jgi:hypothetical protein